jgi:ketosteroid isomerase-like protein
MPDEQGVTDLKELTLRSVDAFGRRDFDGLLALYSENAVWDSSAIGLGVYEGRETIRALFEDWLGAFEDFEQAVREFRSIDNRITLVIYRQRGRPTGSVGHVEFDFALVTTWRNGLVRRVTPYTDIDEARAAAERLAEERG